ncbi:MAG: YegP family protein [Allosphingosinicella sp.]
MHFEIYERERSVVASLRGSRLMAGGDWRWRLKRDDDQVIASGDGYPTRSECERAVMMMKQEVAAAPINFL